jgi:hypothetical protein
MKNAASSLLEVIFLNNIAVSSFLGQIFINNIASSFLEVILQLLSPRGDIHEQCSVLSPGGDVHE